MIYSTRLIKMVINSSNIVLKTITNMSVNGLHSVRDINKRFLQSKLYMECILYAKHYCDIREMSVYC